MPKDPILLRLEYIKNPPEGLSADDIRNMSIEELLDLDYFLNEDPFAFDEPGAPDWERIGRILRVALYNFQQGCGLDKPVSYWNTSIDSARSDRP